MVPKVSVIVPVYNVQEYLEKCLTSIIQQTETDFELILIDDGSKDGSSEILDRYAAKDSRIIVKHNKNQGVSASRNEGIQLASADWLMFVDSDDWLDKDALKKLYANIREDADIVDGAYIVASDENTPKSDLHDANRSSFVTDKQLLYNCCIVNPKTHKGIYQNLTKKALPSLTFVWGKLYRKSVITSNNLLFSREVKRGEDQMFNLEFTKHMRGVVKIEQEIYFYRYREMSASHKWENAVAEYILYATEINSILSETGSYAESKDFWNLKKFEIINKIFELANSTDAGQKQDKKRIIRDFILDVNFQQAISSPNALFNKKQMLLQFLLKHGNIGAVMLIFKLYK